jgi:hypothetical protein
MRMPAAVAASAAAQSKARPLPPPAVLRLHRVAVPGKTGTDGYRHEFAGIAKGFALLGATQAAIGDLFGVDEETVRLWKHAHPKFRRALDEGSTYADALVAHAFYKRCIGYDTTITTTERRESRDGAGSLLHITTVTTTEEKHIAPDVGACWRWLGLRQHWYGVPQLTIEDILRYARAAKEEALRRGLTFHTAGYRAGFADALETAQRRPINRCPECGGIIVDAREDEDAPPTP